MRYTSKKAGRRDFILKLRKQWMLQMIILMGLVYLAIFNYWPMTGLLIAFKKYKLSSGVAGFFSSPWVGLKWFREFFGDYMFGSLMRNTVGLSMLKILLAFPVPIVFALMLNEMRAERFKKLVQTASYLPHFISWIIVSGMLYTFFSSAYGLMPKLLASVGVEMPSILTEPGCYWPLAILTEIWKEMGWNAIIFIAAIAGVDPALHEVADIDGAGRLQRIWHVTLPGIRGTIVVMLILSLGSIANGNFDQTYLLGNAVNYEASEIIGTYVLDVGLVNQRYDYAAAVGLLQSVSSVILVLGANAICRRTMQISLY